MPRLTGLDLVAELRAAVEQRSHADGAFLLARGIDRGDVNRLCGIERVRVLGEYYEPLADEGIPAIITPIRVCNVLTPEAADPSASCRSGALVDLIAWHPATPQSWALRVGAAEWLGAIAPQYLEPDPVIVRRSVLGWFRAGCSGLVLLSPTLADRYRILSGCSAIIAEDAEHAAELRSILQHPWPAPRMFIARRGRYRHAT
jgi:hypothetical protein